jgi:hypothetical protein
LKVKYVKVRWDHHFTDDPVLYISELGDDGYETRKLQRYQDGRWEWADEGHETATVGLSEIPFPSVEEISGQPGFDAEVISKEEFERTWAEARDLD